MNEKDFQKKKKRDDNDRGKKNLKRY